MSSSLDDPSNLLAPDAVADALECVNFRFVSFRQQAGGRRRRARPRRAGSRRRGDAPAARTAARIEARLAEWARAENRSIASLVEWLVLEHDKRTRAKEPVKP